MCKILAGFFQNCLYKNQLMGEILEEINCRSNIQKQTTFLKTFEKFQVTLKIASFNFLASDSREQVQLKKGYSVFKSEK